MAPKKVLLHVIQNTLTELGYPQLAIQVENEAKLEGNTRRPSSDIEISKSKYISWFNSELKNGKYSTILTHLVSSLNHFNNEMVIDDDGDDIQFSNASDVNLLELLNDNSNVKVVIWIITYLIKRTFLLECLVVFSQSTDGVSGDIGKTALNSSTDLIDYLKDELLPILDSIHKEAPNLEEFNSIFDKLIIRNLSREKESNKLLPLLMHLPHSAISLKKNVFTSETLYTSVSVTDTSPIILIGALRGILVNTYLSLVFKSGLNDRNDFRPQIPVNYLQKLIEQATLYQQQQLPYFLPPRTAFDKSPITYLPFTRELHEASHKSFPTALLHTLTEHSNEVWFSKFSPLGKYLISGSLDGKVVIYSVKNNFKVIGILESNSALENQALTTFSKIPSNNSNKAVLYCCWNENEDYIVSCHLDTIVRVWSLGRMKEDQLMLVELKDSSSEGTIKLVSCFTLGQNIRTCTCEFLPSTTTSKPIFIVGSLDKVLKAYDIDGMELFDFYGNSDDNINADEKFKDRPNDMSDEDDDNLEKPKSDSLSLGKKKIQGIFTRVNDLSVSPNGKFLITANNDKRINFYRIPYKFDDVSTTTKLATLNLNGRLTSCSISKSSDYLLVSVVPEELQLWDISSLNSDSGPPILHKIYFGPIHNTSQIQSANIIRSSFGYLAGDEEELVLSGSDDGFVYIWKARTGQLITRVNGHRGSCNCVDWNTGYIAINDQRDYGKLWCSVGDDKTLKIWGPPDWKN